MPKITVSNSFSTMFFGEFIPMNTLKSVGFLAFWGCGF